VRDFQVLDVIEKEKVMEDQTKKNEDEQSKKGKPLPFCTTAPSPEHARPDNDDEPCDDGRSGS
jgi:hypothetical protein